MPRMDGSRAVIWCPLVSNMPEIFWKKCLRFHLVRGYMHIYRIPILSINTKLLQTALMRLR